MKHLTDAELLGTAHEALSSAHLGVNRQKRWNKRPTKIDQKCLQDSIEICLTWLCSSIQEKIQATREILCEILKEAQQEIKTRRDSKRSDRNFSPSDKVLVYLPQYQKPLQSRFHGPYKIVKKLNDLDYVVSTSDRRSNLVFATLTFQKDIMRGTQARSHCWLRWQQSLKSQHCLWQSQNIKDLTQKKI